MRNYFFESSSVYRLGVIFIGTICLVCEIELFIMSSFARHNLPVGNGLGKLRFSFTNNCCWFCPPVVTVSGLVLNCISAIFYKNVLLPIYMLLAYGLKLFSYRYSLVIQLARITVVPR